MGKRIRRRVLGDKEPAMALVEVGAERAVESVEVAVAQAEELAEEVAEAEEVRTLYATAVAKKVTSARGAPRRTASAINASSWDICSRCARETSQKMAETLEEVQNGILEEAPVLDLVKAQGE